MMNDKRIAYYGNSRTDVLALLPDDFHIQKSLDVGCGLGETSRALKSQYGVEHTVGIERETEIAERARVNLDELVVGSIEDETLPFRENEFDLVILADVLEHLYDPWRTLDRCAAMTKKDGYILISVPNIQNWKILVRLAFGRWEYQKSGIMDRTHLRFFTVNSLLTMLKRRPLRLLSLKRTMGIEVKVLNILTLGLFRNHLAYHIYVCAQKI